VGLFAGIGGFEIGLSKAGHESVLLCDVDPNAQTVLRARFPGVPIQSDVRDVRGLPRGAEVVAAGFPCTDLSQAGRVAGIFGDQSGLVGEVFRIVGHRLPAWLVIENVQNMLVLGRGQAIRHVTSQLEGLGMRWAYRVVDSRFAGVPQRRRRVIIVASRQHDPREVLFADDAGERPEADYRSDAFGFYWTEGLRGLGWAQDAVPTLKGGSTIGIPSPPGIWVPDAAPGRKLVVPGAEDAEALQGFERGWTSVCSGRRTEGTRLKLVGNAVSTGVAHWLGERLNHPAAPLYEGVPVQADEPWRSAAWGEGGRRWSLEEASEFPLHRPYQHLTSVIDVRAAAPVSHRGAAGFLSRARRAKLRFDEAFLRDVAEHVEATAAAPLTEAG
jgi:DNA (cytosine-5)-methyltransferase 1